MSVVTPTELHSMITPVVGGEVVVEGLFVVPLVGCSGVVVVVAC